MEYTIGTKVFGDWEIIAEIGEGSYGKVYQLRKENFGISTNGALKVIQIPRSHADVKDALSQGMDEQSVTSYFKGVADELMREVAVMSDMKSHPNVVGCQDYDIIPHTGGIGWDILIRMDLLTPLQEYQTRYAMDETQVRRLGADLCEALIYCQKRGLIHRDIKPGNIFVDELGRFRLGDFGVARTADKTMGGMSKQGTENYMAPEVYLGREYGPTVDIYSLGMVLYQLMNANRLPFYPLPPAPIEFSHRFEVLKKRMSGAQMPPPCKASEDFAAIILKACSFESKDRYRSAAEFLEALRGTPAESTYAYKAPAEEPKATAPEQPSSPDPVFTFDTATGDETIGPAFTPRAPKAAPQSAQAQKPQTVSAFQTMADSAPAQKKAEPVFQMIVEDAFDIAGRGVVVTGWVTGTTIHTGDPVTVVGKNKTKQSASIAGIEQNHTIISSADPGAAVGILLSGMSTKTVSAGDRLVGKASATAADPVRQGAQNAQDITYVCVDMDWYETQVSCLEPSGEIRTISLPSTLGYADGNWYVGEEAKQLCGNCIEVSHSDDKARKALRGQNMSMQTSIGIFLEQVLQYAYRNGMGSSSTDGTSVTTKIDVLSMMSFVQQKDKKSFIDACQKKNLGTPRICAPSELSALRFCTTGSPQEGKYLFVHLGEQFSEATMAVWEGDILEIIATDYTDDFSALKLNALAEQGYSMEAAANELLPQLMSIVETVMDGQDDVCQVVLCGKPATIPTIRWRLAALLGKEPVVMENAACASTEGGAVMSAMMRHEPRYSGVAFLRMTAIHYGIVDSSGKCLLKMDAGTCMPATVSAKFYAGQNDQTLYLTEGLDVCGNNPRIATKEVPFIGGGELTIVADLNGIIGWAVKPQPDAVKRQQSTAQSPSSQPAEQGTLRCPKCGHGSAVKLDSGFSGFLKSLVSDKNTYMCLKCKNRFEA